MSTARAKFILANALDQHLARVGELPLNRVRKVELTAVMSCGTMLSVLPASIVRQLGIGIRRTRTFQDANGRRENVGLTEAVVFQYQGCKTADEALVLGNEAVIGHTVLAKLGLLRDRTDRRLTPRIVSLL